MCPPPRYPPARAPARFEVHFANPPPLLCFLDPGSSPGTGWRLAPVADASRLLAVAPQHEVGGETNQAQHHKPHRRGATSGSLEASATGRRQPYDHKHTLPRNHPPGISYLTGEYRHIQLSFLSVSFPRPTHLFDNKMTMV